MNQTSQVELDAERRDCFQLFLTAHARLSAAIDKRLVESGALPLPWYDVLVTLETADQGRLRMSDLAERVLLSQSGLTRLVDRLVDKGLVERATCPADRRVLYASLTEAGRQARRASWPLLSRLIQDYFGAHMTDMETRLMRASFVKMVESAGGDPTCRERTSKLPR